MDFLLKPSSFLTLAVTAWCLACCFRARHVTSLGSFSRNDSLPLRGLCVLLVVCGHLVSRTGITFGFLQYVTWHTPAVGIFMFMSGFGTAKSYLKKSDAYLEGYLKHTSQKLLFPLGIAMLAGALLLLLDGRFSPRTIFTHYRQGKTLLCNHSWYVFELYAFALVFWTLAKTLPRKHLPLAILVVTALMYVVMRWLLHWEFFWYVSLFGFPLGFFFAYREQEIRDIAGRHGIAVYATLAALSLVLFGGYALTKNAEFRTLPQAFIGLVAVMCSWILPLPSKGRILYWLGIVSFELYLVHGLVRNYMIKWCGGIMPDGAIRGAMIIAASILAAVVFHFVIVLINGIFEKKV